MSKIKNAGLDQYGAEPFEQLQFGTTGIEEDTLFYELKWSYWSYPLHLTQYAGGHRLYKVYCFNNLLLFNLSTIDRWYADFQWHLSSFSFLTDSLITCRRAPAVDIFSV